MSTCPCLCPTLRVSRHQSQSLLERVTMPQNRPKSGPGDVRYRSSAHLSAGGAQASQLGQVQGSQWTRTCASPSLASLLDSSSPVPWMALFEGWESPRSERRAPQAPAQSNTPQSSLADEAFCQRSSSAPPTPSVRGVVGSSLLVDVSARSVAFNGDQMDADPKVAQPNRHGQSTAQS